MGSKGKAVSKVHKRTTSTAAPVAPDRSTLVTMEGQYKPTNKSMGLPTSAFWRVDTHDLYVKLYGWTNKGKIRVRLVHRADKQHNEGKLNADVLPSQLFVKKSEPKADSEAGDEDGADHDGKSDDDAKPASREFEKGLVS